MSPTCKRLVMHLERKIHARTSKMISALYLNYYIHELYEEILNHVA